MKVSDLQRHLNDLCEMLRSAGAAKPIPDDLAAICVGLAPFRDLPLRGFADFLIRAEAFSRGEVPVVPPKGGRKPGRKPTNKPPAPDVDAIAARVRAIYDRAIDPTLTDDEILAVAGTLDGLKGADLVKVGAAIGYKAPSKIKLADLKHAIIQRVQGAKGSFQRSGMIHPPQRGNGAGVDATTVKSPAD